MAWRKTVVTPLPKRWSHCSLALNHQCQPLHNEGLALRSTRSKSNGGAEAKMAWLINVIADDELIYSFARTSVVMTFPLQFSELLSFMNPNMSSYLTEDKLHIVHIDTRASQPNSTVRKGIFLIYLIMSINTFKSLIIRLPGTVL